MGRGDLIHLSKVSQGKDIWYIIAVQNSEHMVFLWKYSSLTIENM
jgi:hypothetical protein